MSDQSDGSHSLHSKFHNHFYGCAVLITTQQDGYLYQINANAHQDEIAKCFLNVYPFTSSVVDVFFNFNVLHALCENGIESYTHRIGQRMFTDLSGKFNFGDIEAIYKNLTNTISLVNLRPFMNVHRMLASDRHLVLLANDSTGNEDEVINWTIYKLNYPNIDTIYADFKDFADKSLRRYPTYFMNLLEEMHLMIRTQMVLGELELEENSEIGNEMKLVWSDCGNLLRESSLALADCFVM